MDYSTLVHRNCVQYVYLMREVQSFRLLAGCLALSSMCMTLPCLPCVVPCACTVLATSTSTYLPRSGRQLPTSHWNSDIMNTKPASQAGKNLRN